MTLKHVLFFLFQWVSSQTGQMLCGRYPMDSSLLLPRGSVLELVRTCLCVSCILAFQTSSRCWNILCSTVVQKESFQTMHSSWTQARNKLLGCTPLRAPYYMHKHIYEASIRKLGLDHLLNVMGTSLDSCGRCSMKKHLTFCTSSQLKEK